MQDYGKKGELSRKKIRRNRFVVYRPTLVWGDLEKS
jgi:hypothetical protein